MSMQQVVQPKPSANGYGRRRAERDMGTRLDKSQLGKPNSGSFGNTGAVNGGKVKGHESPQRDRLIYLTTCLIGHHVEVHVKNGSVFSGIFHCTNAEKDFGVILKMARLIKDGSSKGQKSLADFVSKAPSKTLIIPAKELVQVIAKSVSVTGDELPNNFTERRQDILIDSCISQSTSVEVRRELERWTPDEDDPQCPETEDIFDGSWNRNRNWDQFKTNAALFGVTSTFDEELYTTKLEKGPQMKELELEATRIAREIEGEATQDLHLAEERGLPLQEDFDVDEETRFSSVFRGNDDSGYQESEDTMLDTQNTETFGGSSISSLGKSFSDIAGGKSDDGAHVSSDGNLVSQENDGRDLECAGSSESSRHLDGESSRMNGNQLREQHGRKSHTKSFIGSKNLDEDAQTSKVEGESSDGAVSSKSHGAAQSVNPRVRPGSSTSSASERTGAPAASSGHGLSPSSSMGSLSSEKSSLNPYAKEFKLNPNAKSFTPSQTPLRPPPPAPDGSYYLPANVSAFPHMPGLPVGMGMGPSFGGPQPVVYNAQASPVQSPPAYMHPNVPVYGQQMIVGHGHPRQFLYMPSYPPDMPYKGRDF
ncbi:hypothetical protein Sjap_019740 [Stephania japonica]|uniref:LsmAD domain-containing protein n=1 Tax=Stephania japonica TaxID=461633 RepID=A0AAP0EZD0_9MAGN